MTMQNIGKAIRHYRKQKDWSQTDLARACGMASNYLSEIESGRKSGNLRSETLYKIAMALGVQTSDLLYFNGEPKVSEVSPPYNPSKQARLLALLEGLSEEALSAIEVIVLLLKKKG